MEGLHLLLAPPYREPKTFEILGRGGIEFAEAGTEPGAKVSGQLYGSIFSFDNNATPFVDAYLINQDAEVVVDIGLLINEVAARGEPLDWFEVYNASDAPIELAKFCSPTIWRTRARAFPSRQTPSSSRVPIYRFKWTKTGGPALP